MTTADNRTWLSIQLFGVASLDGACLSYTGDPWGESLTVRDRHAPLLAENTERAATPAELRAIRIQLMAERYLENEVRCNQSSLVDALLAAGTLDGFASDEIENLYPDPSDWSVATCKAWLDEHRTTRDYPTTSNPFALDRDELVNECEGQSMAAYDDETNATLAAALLDSLDAGDWGDAGDWRDAVRDADPDAQEVYEWWLVSKWLAEELRTLGEPLLDNDYGYWWGRTCTGQAVLLDGTLQQVAAAHLP